MDWKKQFDIHKESSGIIIICVILLIAVLVSFLFRPICSKSAARSRRCIANLNVIPKYMYYTAEEMEPEDLAKMTVADLLQESIRKWKMKKDLVVCPIDGRPYDIFPLSAAEFVRHFESWDHPVPVVMCRNTHVKEVRGMDRLVQNILRNAGRLYGRAQRIEPGRGGETRLRTIAGTDRVSDNTNRRTGRIIIRSSVRFDTLTVICNYFHIKLLTE